MAQELTAQQIADGIYAVGAVDANETKFHGYDVHRGVTYNAYLLRGNNGKYTLIDTVRREQTKKLLARIASVTPLENIEAVIVNHTEPDHSGALPAVLEKTNACVYGTVAAAKLLQGMYGIGGVRTVKNGDSIQIGGRTYNFVCTPMVHWPDNMVTYLPDEQILFSNDALGQHYATQSCLDTDNVLKIALEEAQHYFANIVMPYRTQAAKAVEAIAALPLKMIAPGHGVVWTKHIGDIVDLYNTLCSPPSPREAVVVFDSMWGETQNRKNAAIDEVLKMYNKVSIFDLSFFPISDVMADLATATHVCIGSPTYNGYPTPLISMLVAELEALKPPVSEYSLFGTYGWGGGASKKLTEKLDSFGWKKIFDLTSLL